MKNLIQIILILGIVWIFSFQLLSNSYYNNHKTNKNSNNKKEEYKILPADESAKDASLVRLINELKTIVALKDTNSLFVHLDKNIIVSYGGGLTGIKEFSTYWGLNLPDETGLWKLLTQELKYGGTWEKDEIGKYFCIPYTHSAKAIKNFTQQFDMYILAVCVDAKAKVYNREEANDEYCSGVLNYDVVLMDLDYYKEKFAKISTIGNRTHGYVLAENLLYAADPHLVIRKIDGKWKITAFAPFD